MSNEVQFDEDSLSNASRLQMSQNAAGGGDQPAMVRWLMGRGIAKSATAAQGMLIGVIVVMIVLTYIIIKFLS
ncbi:MAG: hypothetical protein JWO00_302 [Candidatus Parcubacteria bacterium]|nr:hypothetical protein [Candidatus Parcubacteria bacterium]